MELAVKKMPGGRVGTVIPLTFGRARITIAKEGSWVYDDLW
jgi:hypothetical protein